MNEKVKEFLGKLRDGLKKVSRKVWILIGIGLVLIVAAAVIYVAARPYATLIAGSSSEEIAAVLSWLEEQGVTDYKLEGSDTILVPKARAANLKARLLMEGYPQSGYSFDYSTYTESVSMLSTESEREKAWLMAIQEQLIAVIECLEGVQDAAVVITPGEDNRYVLDSGNVIKASASVTVTMKNGGTLSSEMASSIRHLVANGVQGLEVDSVELIDSWGNRYTAGDEDGLSADASDLKMRLEEEYDNKIRAKVMQVLLPMFGDDNVRVSVNTVVDVNRTVGSSINYELPEYAQDGSTDGRGIIGSEIWSDIVVRDPDEVVGGVVGGESNADLSTYVEEELQPDGSELNIEASGQKDYLHDTYEEQVIRTAGYITDCTVAVSINSTTAGTVDLDTIRIHTARAAGINAVATEEMTAEEYLRSKISVYSGPFYEEPVTPPAPDPEFPVPYWAIYAAAGGLLLFLILLIIILRIRRKRRKRREEERQRREVEELLAAAGMVEAEPVSGADVMSMQSERSMELRKDIRQFAEENPEIAAQMLKMWLRGGDEDG